MSGIDDGIKQPLRFYDKLEKQNFRREWIKDTGLTDWNVLINPANIIMPFQIRRRRSPNLITTFDLYTYNALTKDFEFDLSVFTIIDGSTVDHLRVLQMQGVDNIVWNPRKSFLQNLDCGLHYIHLSDGVFNWYSEVFKVDELLDTESVKRISILPKSIGVTATSSIGWVSGGDNYQLIISKKPL